MVCAVVIVSPESLRICIDREVNELSVYLVDFLDFADYSDVITFPNPDKVVGPQPR